MTPLEQHLWANLVNYVPMMWSTLDPRYRALRIPNDTIVIRGQWVRPLSLDPVTP